MSDKVVDMEGKPVVPLSETHPKVRDALERALSDLNGETHVGIGIVLVDAMGRVGTKYFWKSGFAHAAISGAALLQRRMLDDYESSLSSEATKPGGAA